MNHLTRREFLAASAGAVMPQPDTPRPNVLLILPDQLRAQSLGYMGNTDIQTPNIDKLASESVVLPNTFANSPVCCPARANILTGTYAHRNGMTANDLRLREDKPGLAKALKAVGYRTGFVGKWHLDGGPRLPGFVPPGPRRQGFTYWAANQCSHEHFNNHYFRDTQEPIPLNGFEAAGWTDLAIEFLRESANQRRPFFLTVQPGPPHDPYIAPPEYAKRYDPAKLRMRANWRGGPGIPGPKEIAQYYGMITAVDDQIGRLMKTLDELHVAQDTIVVLASDHGDMLGSQGLRLKRKPWEESIRIPGLIRYPRMLRPRRVPYFFTHVDFAPTLLGFCGIAGPGNMQGADLSRLLRGLGSIGPTSAYFQIFGPYRGDGTDAGWRGVRTAQYMYARYRDRPWVLYDLERDPEELHNLAGDPSKASVTTLMESSLRDWMERTGDSWGNNWNALVEDDGRLYTKGTFYSVQEYLASTSAKP